MLWWQWLINHIVLSVGSTIVFKIPYFGHCIRCTPKTLFPFYFALLCICAVLFCTKYSRLLHYRITPVQVKPTLRGLDRYTQRNHRNTSMTIKKQNTVSVPSAYTYSTFISHKICAHSVCVHILQDMHVLHVNGNGCIFCGICMYNTWMGMDKRCVTND